MLVCATGKPIGRCRPARFAISSTPALAARGSDFEALLRVFRENILPFSRHNAHPRMFGYVQSPGTPIAVFADLLASAQANLTAWRSRPGGGRNRAPDD